MPRGCSSLTDRYSPVLAAAALALASGCATAPPSTLPGPQTPQVFSDPQEGVVNFLLYLPDRYAGLPGPWPLILFLHGAGERGDDLGLVKREALPRLLERNRDFPFVVVSPQCRRKKEWSWQVLDRLLTEVLEKYRVDAARIYVTGLSSGAVASLELAMLRPERIAAAVAVAPNHPPGDVCRAKSVPIWLFHNAFDERVPARVSRRLARSLEDCGGEVRLTTFPQAGHDAWSDAYARGDLYAWLLEHRKAGQ